MVYDMNPPSFLGKGGNGKNLFDPCPFYIIGENPIPIFEEEEGSIKAPEISRNRTIELAIFQVKGAEAPLINGFPQINIVSSLHELQDSGIAH